MLAQVWPQAKEHLAAAIETTGGTHTPEDVFKAIYNGNAQLWVGNRSAGVTEVSIYPQSKAIRIFLAGGDFEEMKYMGRILEAGAKKLGFDRIEIGGRRGFLRTLPGYKELCTYMYKTL